MSYEDRKIVSSRQVILFEKGTIELSYLLEMTDGADIEDISLKLEKPDCYHYGDYGCDCKVALFLESSRLESDEEYYKRVNNYLEKLNRKKNPEAKLKLKEKREGTLKQKQEEQKKKDMAELERLKKLYE